MSHELLLDEVRDALEGVWDVTRARFWMRAAQGAATDRDWTAATNRLLHLTGPLDDIASGSPAWRRLAQTSLETALLAESTELVRAVARETFERAWPADSEPNELRARALPLAQKVCGSGGKNGLEAAVALGQLLRSRFPLSPLCIYASAHFRELQARAGGGAVDDAHDIASDFDHAANVFEARGASKDADHCRMRAGVLWLTATRQSDRGRSALRAFRGRDLSRAEQRWLAFGHAHSPFWLDRVRAGDWVGDTLDEVDEESAEAEAAYAVAEVLFRKLPVEVTDPEHDRLSSLLENLDQDRRWTLEAQLRGRLAVAEHLEVPLDELSPETAEELQQESLPLTGLVTLSAAWKNEDFDEESGPPIVRALVHALRNTATEGDEEDEHATARKLRDLVIDAQDAAQLRPIILPLLRWCQSPEAPPETISEIAIHYAARGPAPTFGFLPLAVQLFKAKLNRAGAAVTRRALDEGETDSEFLEFAVARATQWAVREGSDRDMLHWLEAAKPFLDDSA